MKTTSYEISRQLAEAGFEAETEFYCVKWNEGEPELVHESQQTPNLIESVPAWDLETILEALPSRITNENFDKVPSWNLETILEVLPSRITNENIFIQRIDYYLRLSKEEIWYENECNCDSDESCPVDQRFEVSRIKNESLADTAARLLLLLHEKNLIKF